MSSIILITFKTTQSALKAEKILKKEKISFTLTPTPASISAGCGLSIEFSGKFLEQIIEILDKKKIRWDKYFKDF